MTNNVLAAAILAAPLLVGNAVSSCGGEPTLRPMKGVLPDTAVAARSPALPVPAPMPSAADAVEKMRLYASMLFLGTPPIEDVPKTLQVPQVVVIAQIRPDGTLSLQFPPGPPPAELHMVFLLQPEDALTTPPVWYDEETDRIAYCHACQVSEPFSSETLGLLYIRALFDQATAKTPENARAQTRRLMAGTRLLSQAVDRATGGKMSKILTNVLESRVWSEAVTPGSLWRIPSDSGWTSIDLVWPWTTKSDAETRVVDELVLLFGALQQGHTPAQQVAAFRAVWDYVQDGC